MRRRAVAALLLAATAPAAAQTVTTIAPNRVSPQATISFGKLGQPAVPVDATNPLPVGGKQEAIQLASANVAAGPVTVYGGDYSVSQVCTGYGSGAFQALGPDGAAWQTLVTKSAADTAGGTGVTLGSSAIVRVVLTGTTGCVWLLSRLP